MRKQLIITIDKSFHRKLKMEALRQNKTLRQFVIEILEAGTGSNKLGDAN